MSIETERGRLLSWDCVALAFTHTPSLTLGPVLIHSSCLSSGVGLRYGSDKGARGGVWEIVWERVFGGCEGGVWGEHWLKHCA